MAPTSFQGRSGGLLSTSEVIHEVTHGLSMGTMTEEEADEILAHYGIKGMRWGIRRPVGSDGLVGGPKGSSDEPGIVRKAGSGAATATKFVGRSTWTTAKATGRGVAATGRGVAKANQVRKDRKSAKTMKKISKGETKGIDIKKLSNAELKAMIDRLNLEQQYTNLTKPPSQEKKKKGENFIWGALKDVGAHTIKRQGKAISDGKLDPLIKEWKKGQQKKQKK